MQERGVKGAESLRSGHDGSSPGTEARTDDVDGELEAIPWPRDPNREGRTGWFGQRHHISSDLSMDLNVRAA